MDHMELDWLERWSRYSPDAVALKDGDDGRELTYAEFHRRARAGAAALAARFGIARGDRVAVLAANELEYVTLFFAVQRLGAILVPVNYRLTSREVEHVLADSRPKLLVFQPEFAAVIEGVDARHRPETLALRGPASFAEASEGADVPAPFAARPEDPCMIIYTSGTTGAPKGAVLTHKMLFWNSINTALRLDLRQDDCTVTFAPFFHTGGWNVLTTPFIHRGARTIFLKKFDAGRILELCDSEKCTILFGLPTTMEMMARAPGFRTSKLAGLRFAVVGGEPMPLEAIRTWHAKGVMIRQGYGLTEFGPNCFSLGEKDAERKIGSIGFPNFYVDAKIVGDDGRELGADEIGELALRGPMAMAGYWNNEAATKEVLKDGWLHTGDLVRRDAEGFYYVVGRKKDMFKSGGENVYPAELEKVLRALPGVREAAVIGVPDVKWGECGRAFVVRENDALTEADVREHCARNLAKFKVPKEFVFLPELPKSDSGKILKKNLRAIAP